MAKDIGELVKEPPFIMKAVDFLASLVGVIFLSDVGCLKTTCQNMALYGALVGGLLTGLGHMWAYYQDEKSPSYEMALLGLFGLLNLFAAYILFQKLDFGCGCSGKGLLPVFGATVVTGGCMVADVAIYSAKGSE